jgi:Ribbon-helix-helix protein, copG family
MERAEGGSKPVMVRVSQPMYERLRAIAQAEETSVATVLRRLAAERLNQIAKDEKTRRKGHDE